MGFCTRLIAKQRRLLRSHRICLYIKRRHIHDTIQMKEYITMNIAIVDDEPGEIETLSAVIKEYAALNKLDIRMDAFRSAEELLKDYRPYAYTAIFMDVYMDRMDGVSAARKIFATDRHAIIIFLTSSDEHMPEAFSLHAYDYIGKPAKKERLFKVMDDVLQKVTEYSNTPKLSFMYDRREISIRYPDIVMVKTAGRNYLEIMENTRKSYQTRLTFSEVSALLSKDNRFLPVLRGILVNMDYIVSIDQEICELAGGIRLSINVRNAKELKTTWQNYKLDCIRSDRKSRRGKG